MKTITTQGRSKSRASAKSRPFGKSSFGGARKFNRHKGNGNRTKRKMPTFDPSMFINKNPVDIQEVIYKPKNTFDTFGLDKRISKIVSDLGFTSPSPIQDQTIPEIVKGNDIIGLAETGTGKTAAFLLPLIQKTLLDMKQQTLILAPTRELAIQIKDELFKFTKGMNIYSTVLVGGISERPQIKSLYRNNHFIIGTPGRVLDLLDREYFKPYGITNVVLDEADRMLDMGFIHDMRKILGKVPTDRQTLLFSATMTKDAEGLVNEFMKNPVSISVKKTDVTNSIAQDVIPFTEEDKFETLLSELKKPEYSRVIIFGAMKFKVERLSKDLSRKGVKAVSIHGNKSHSQRQKALKDVKSGYANVLVATDVAARGIHIDDVSHVINYDLPGTFEDYVHRIGRTGRGEKRGQALTFVPTK